MGDIEIAGVIETEDGLTLRDVDVTLSDGSSINQVMTTGADGLYNFPNLIDGEDYVVTPFNNTEDLNGFTTFDLVLMTQHILGVNELDSPYKIIAADINGDGKVTTSDVVRGRQLILFIIPSLSPDNTSWKFVPKDFIFTNPDDPFDQTIPQILSYPNIESDELNADFIAIKVGDLNNNVETNLIGDDLDRSEKDPMYLMVDDVAVIKGETYTIDFKAKDFKEILGYQFTLEFDENKMQFAGIESGALEMTEGNFGLQLLEKGIITTSWNALKANSIEDETILFSLTFEALDLFELKNAFEISSRFTKSESYQQDGEHLEVELLFEEKEILFPISDGEFDLYSNRPNPFSNTTTIAFVLPDASPVTMTIYDVAGKILKVIEGDYSKGYNEVYISKKDCGNAAGVLYCHLKAGNNSDIKKMILID